MATCSSVELQVAIKNVGHQVPNKWGCGLCERRRFTNCIATGLIL